MPHANRLRRTLRNNSPIMSSGSERSNRMRTNIEDTFLNQVRNNSRRYRASRQRDSLFLSVLNTSETYNNNNQRYDKRTQLEKELAYFKMQNHIPKSWRIEDLDAKTVTS